MNPPPASERPPHHRWWWLAALLPALLLAGGQFQYWGYVKDDTFITLRYARNLADGLGLVFNPGEPALEGYTNFLWVLFTSLPHRLGWDALLVAKGLSLLAAAGGVAYTAALAGLWSRRPGEQQGSPLVALLAACLYAASTSIALWGQSGLEGPAVGMLFPAALFHFSRAREHGTRREWLVGALCAAAAALLRPEGHLLFFVGVAAALLPGAATAPEREPGLELRRGLKWLGGGLGLLLLALLIVAIKPLPRADRIGDARATLLAQAGALPIAALWLGLGSALVAGVAALLNKVEERIPRRLLATFRFLVGYSVVVAPYHLFRLAVFGSLLPNTYLVKGAAGPEVFEAGQRFLSSLLVFNHMGLLLGLAVLGVCFSARRVSRLLAAGIVLIMCAYLVKIGRDEMKYFRIFFPALGFTCALAAEGLRRAWRPAQGAARVFTPLGLLGLLAGLRYFDPGERADQAWTLAERVPLAALPWIALGCAAVLAGIWLAATRSRPTPLMQRLPASLAGALGIVVVALIAHDNQSFSVRKGRWNSNYIRWSERSFQAMGSYVEARSEPGERIVFQDMGAAPYAGGSLQWLDVIGIVNKRVATELYAIRMNPFLRGAKRSTPGGRAQIERFDANIRDYMFGENPRWVAVVAYISRGRRDGIKRRFRAAEGDPAALEDLFVPLVRNNSHYHGMLQDPRFERHFELHEVWRRNDGYYLVLFERRDG